MSDNTQKEFDESRDGEVISRRSFIAGAVGLTGLGLSGCTSTHAQIRPPKFMAGPRVDVGSPGPAQSTAEQLYAALPNEQFPIPAIDISKVDPKYYRRQVAYQSEEAPGTVIVDTHNFYLYLVQGDGTAMRYGVGLGRAGFEWSGRARIAWKQKWPKWTPPDDMISRQPELVKYSADNGGMPAGLNNPLGARALYIFQGDVDTLYRIHGTPEYLTIGKAVSSGCVRMMNQDVIDLYDRVRTNVPVLVL